MVKRQGSYDKLFAFIHGQEPLPALKHIRTDISMGKHGTFGNTGVLAGLYLVIIFFSAIITNNATAVLMFPIAYTTTFHHPIVPPVELCSIEIHP